MFDAGREFYSNEISVSRLVKSMQHLEFKFDKEYQQLEDDTMFADLNSRRVESSPRRTPQVNIQNEED